MAAGVTHTVSTFALSIFKVALYTSYVLLLVAKPSDSEATLEKERRGSQDMFNPAI